MEAQRKTFTVRQRQVVELIVERAAIEQAARRYEDFLKL